MSQVKIDTFPPSSDCEANDGQMLESSWERLHVWRKAVQTQAQVSDSELWARVFVSFHMNRIFVGEIIHSVHVPRPHKLNEDENKIKPSFRL